MTLARRLHRLGESGAPIAAAGGHLADGDSMRLLWYWPFAREEELSMARSRAWEKDEILIEVIDRDAAPEAGSDGGVTVVRDLPDIQRTAGPVRWAPSRIMTYAARAAARRRHWASGGFDLVHLHYVNRYTDALVPLPRPLVMSVHDVVPHVPRLGARVEHRLLRRLYDRPDAIVVHHPAVGEELMERFGVGSGRIHVVEYPVLTAGGSDPPEGPLTVLMFGALRPNKGLEVLDRAMDLLRGEEVQLVIAGRGHEALERRARQMAARDQRIRAEIGFVSLERKTELFRKASVVAIPYTSFSSQSAVLQDSYGYRRPVVVTDVGALGRTVRDDGTGVVVEPNDPRQLADAILDLSRPEAWATAAAACEQVASRRSPERFGHQLRAVYQQVAR